jgi:hypothetical protein
MHVPPFAVLFLALVPIPLPSDPAGVYAVLDRVVLQPNAEAPTAAELHGAFALAEGHRGQYYRAPQVGVLRFQLGKDGTASVQQWRELAAVAGTGQIVAFGSRYEQGTGKAALRVESPDAVPAAATPFATGWGVHALTNVNYGPARELSLLPRCASADLGGERTHEHWPQRTVVFTATNCAAGDEDLRYVFRAETSDGDRFASGLVAPGKGITTWTTDLALQVGETVTWSVQVVGAKVERAPVASAAFTVPAAAVERGK